MSRLRTILAAGAAATLIAPMLTAPPATAQPVETLYVFDTRPFLENQPSQKLAYDHLKLITAIQGLVNRETPQLHIIADESQHAVQHGFHPDEFWLEHLTGEGEYLNGADLVELTDYDVLLDEFADLFEGVVVWDEAVPATSNLASTAAGVESLLPVRYDTQPGSPYDRLVTERSMSVGLDLVGKFTGQGTIPDSDTPSSGSAKNDAYRWAKARWLDTGLTNPHLITYALDAISWSFNETAQAESPLVVSTEIPDTIVAGESAEVSITYVNGTTTCGRTCCA